MIKAQNLDTPNMRLMTYTVSENSYIADVHRKVQLSVLDDAEGPVNFTQLDPKIKQYMDSDTVGWVCKTKNPVQKIGLVYFSNVIPGLSALFHPVFDIAGYLVYLRNGGNRFTPTVEFSQVALNYMFNTLKLQRVTGVFFDCNVNAINLCKKLGFEQEGIMKKGTKVNNKPIDTVILGLVR